MLSALVAMTVPVAVHAQTNDASSAPTPLAQALAPKFLKSLPREWSGTSARDCKTYEDKNIDKLSPSFAMAAAHFLRSFVEVHGHVTITSAHRTAREQACVCEGERGPCAGRPRLVKTTKGRRIVRRSTSRHQGGIALDVRAGTGRTTNLLAWTNSHSSIRSSGCAFRWAIATDRTWSQVPRATDPYGSPLLA